MKIKLFLFSQFYMGRRIGALRLEETKIDPRILTGVTVWNKISPNERLPGN